MIHFFLRKSIHLLSSIIPLTYIFVDKKTAITGVSIALSIFLLAEILRFRTLKFKTIFFKFFGKMLKEDEKNKITGATWVMLSCFLCISLFKKEIAILSLLFMSISDNIASITGRFWGKHRIFNKTLEGSLGFFISAFIITLFFKINMYIKICSSLIGTLVEIFPLPLDDNLLIPLITGGLLEILT